MTTTNNVPDAQPLIQPPYTTDGLPLFDLKQMRDYWELTLPPQLEPDETIRIVTQVFDTEGTKLDYGIVTESSQFRTADDVAKKLIELQNKHPKHRVGVSTSTAVFNHTGNPPKLDAFKYSQGIAFDIDTHLGKTKDRYRLGTLDNAQIEFAAMVAWLELNRKMQKYGVGSVAPKAAILTGGGLQLVYGFRQQLNKAEASKIYSLLKAAIGNHTWSTHLGDRLGNYNHIAHDVDATSTDMVHVQRTAGTINQKYAIPAKPLRLFGLTPQQLQALKLELLSNSEISDYPKETKEKYKTYIEDMFKLFIKTLRDAEPDIEVKDNMITAKMQSTRASIRPSELKSSEYDLLQKLKATGIDPLTLIQGEVRLGPSTGNLTKLYCPFHEERNPSMAFYRNELFDVIKDFHDNETYSFVQFWEKLYNCTKTDAITAISEKAGINLGRSERKDFQNLELDELVDELLKKVDQERFVYYRLANRGKTCVARDITTGVPHVFDGPKLLTNMVLQEQLRIVDAEQQLVDRFSVRFQETILVDAFEEFNPGGPTVFNKDFIKFVNLWVPSTNYKKVHARADEIDSEFTIDETISILKRKCPWTYKYILQIVQNGDLKWFMNWLSATSKFITVPTVPVVFGVQGAGKNVFVERIMEFYLNSEYTKTISGDRMMQQFNSILESTSLLVLDEGDFSNGKEIDQLKLLTGNNKILIEKKGVDATNKERHFNVLFFSNGEVPIRHPAMDRRITYFNNEIPLLASANVWGESIDSMLDKVKEEMVEFWAVIFKTQLDHKMAMGNSKNGQFWKQVLIMHPFGALIVKLMQGKWQDIALQLNENVQDKAEMAINLNLLEEIKTQFESSGSISMTLINRYLSSLNFKMKQSIQKFIQTNHLHEFGIHSVIDVDDVKIVVDRKKVQEQLKVDNVLLKAYPKTAHQDVSELEAQLADVEAEVEVEAERAQYAGRPTPPPPPTV